VPEPPHASKPVAITGGTGFIGSHLVRRLTGEGTRVRVLTRQPRAVVDDSLRHPSVALVHGETTDRDAVDRLVDGAGTVYHLAGCARAWVRDRHEYERVNVDGTRAVCGACEARDVPTLVHVSTNLVERGDDAGRIVTEYQRTKLRGEEVVRGYIERGRRAVVVRPSRVYGPGPLTESNAVTRIVDFYRRGLFRVRIADGGARGNYVFVEDVVDGIVRAARHGAPGAAYTLGGENATFDEVLATLAAVTGKGNLVLALPLAVARGIGRLAEMAARFGIRPPITPEWVSLFALDWPSSSEAAERELGYAPRSLRGGIELTVRWLAFGRDPWRTA
jgi:nucleoside-diphosphate-sugar epimerase